MPNKEKKIHDKNCATAVNAQSARERELVMKVTKEIVVKFVEMGKVTPSSFDEVFTLVHRSVNSAMRGGG